MQCRCSAHVWDSDQLKNTVIVTGVKEIDRRLKTLPLRVQKKIVRKGMRAGLKVMAAEVKQEVPVLTGLTRSAVKVRAVKRRKRNSIELEVSISGKVEGLTVTPRGGGKPAFYPAVIEYGRSDMEANPFMLRAYDNKAVESRNTTMKLIRDGVEDEATKPS